MTDSNPAPKKSIHSRPVYPMISKRFREVEDEVHKASIRAQDYNKEALLFLLTRVSAGRKTYGDQLHTFNGRDSLLDALEELADAVLYLYQFFEENEALVHRKNGRGGLLDSWEAKELLDRAESLFVLAYRHHNTVSVRKIHGGVDAYVLPEDEPYPSEDKE